MHVQRFVPAAPDRVFAAWTDPEEIVRWWGPSEVRCIAAEVDLRVGGEYRIANELPDKTVLWISGQFDVVDKPRLLVYSWKVGNESSTTERVEVRFIERKNGTDVVVTHQRIATEVLREQHRLGWEGCIDGLVTLMHASR